MVEPTPNPIPRASPGCLVFTIVALIVGHVIFYALYQLTQ